MHEYEFKLLNRAAQAIFDKKGYNILALDLKGIVSITDYVLIAEGNVDKHVVSIAREVEKALQNHGISPLHREGMDYGDWIVLDYGWMIVHLFMPGLRDIYHLEQLWREGEIVDLLICNYPVTNP